MSIILPGMNYQVLSANAALLACQAARYVDVPMSDCSADTWIPCQASMSHLLNAMIPQSHEVGARCYSGPLQIIGGDISPVKVSLQQSNSNGHDKGFWDFAIEHPLLIPSIPLAFIIVFMSIRAFVTFRRGENDNESLPNEIPAVDKDTDTEKS